MSSPPTGTITFLFTDIEGSTKLAQTQAELWSSAQARHHAILRNAIEAHHGFVFRIIGDAFCAAFATASDALLAVVEAQRNLPSATINLQLRVRAGLHTGAAEWQSNDYDGYVTLARVQRIMSVAYGEQVLLSQTTYDLVRDSLPSDVTLREMGEHRLKGLVNLERLWQVVAPDMRQDFPPLQSLNTLPNNLPIQVTSFIGREKEITELKRLLTPEAGVPSSTAVGVRLHAEGPLPSAPHRGRLGIGGPQAADMADTPGVRPGVQAVRLLTLTGSGGCGKTRLSLQVAANVLETFADGAWLVELAPLADPALVPQAIASALGLQEQAGRLWIDSLSDYLRSKHLLLVLDNCEHLVEACASVADQLLHRCPKISILASSREPLGIAGETTYRVPSLSLPDPRQFVGGGPSGPFENAPGGQLQGLPLGSLVQYEAVRLFIERAVAVQPSFALTNQNAPAVAQICHRLDGIPLALELAAARVKMLKVEQIAARLDDRFRLLSGGSRTAMPRQQTLRAAIDWSYELLTEPERVLLRRLAVFASGWTLEAAEAITSARSAVGSTRSNFDTESFLPAADVLDLLTHLADRSLIVVEDAGEEARYRLLETIRQYAHEKLLNSGEAEHIREQHLEFFLTVAEKAEPQLYGAEPAKWLKRLDTEHDNLRAAIEWATERGNVECGLRLAVALSWFWFMRVYYTEGRARIGALIERANTLAMTPQLSLAVARALNRAADFAQDLGDFEKARSFSEQSLQMAAPGEDKDETAHSLYNLARLALAEGDHAKAAALYDQSIAQYRAVKDKRGLGGSLQGLAVALTRQGNLAQAVSLYEEVIALRQEMNDKTLLAFALDQLGRVEQLQGNLDRAAVLHKESLRLRINVDNKRGIAFSFLSFASLAVAHENADRAARLYGAGDAWLEVLHAQEEFRDAVVHVKDVALARAQLEEAAFNTARNEGRAMTMEQAIEYALRQE